MEVKKSPKADLEGAVCQLRGTGQACISLVRMRVSEPQGKPNGVQV